MKKQGLPVREPSKRKHGPCLVAPHFLIHLQTVVCVCVGGRDFNGHFVSVFAPLLRVMVEDNCCTAWISKSFPEPRSQTQPFAKAVYLEATGRSLSFVSQVFFLSYFWVKWRKSQPPRPNQAPPHLPRPPHAGHPRTADPGILRRRPSAWRGLLACSF